MATIQTTKEIPTYMEKGSKGPAVVVLLSFLNGWALSWGEGGLPEGFQIGDELDMDAMTLVAQYQEDNGLDVDGGCGPQMRTDMTERGFNFEAAARAAGGATKFVQLDGSYILWAPNFNG